MATISGQPTIDADAELMSVRVVFLGSAPMSTSAVRAAASKSTEQRAASPPKAANCPIRIGGLARGDAELMNASGGIGEGTAASADAKSTKGLVRSSVTTQDNLRVTVCARTRRDDTVIYRVAA